MGIISPDFEKRLGASRTRKTDIARGFGNASRTYESASRLQRLMGNTLLQNLPSLDPAQTLQTALDLGCGTGWFTRKLQEQNPGLKLCGVDLSPGMVQEARENSATSIDWLVADAECLPLPRASQDLVFSNLMIQWCDDPRSVLRECRRVLRPGGLLLVSTLTEGTLAELKAAWALADPGHSHINQFESVAALEAKVSAELPAASVETRTLRLPYDSPMALARELRHLGAGFRGAGRRQAATAPGRMRAMCDAYPRQPDGTVMASYEAAWVYWQKPRSGGR